MFTNIENEITAHYCAGQGGTQVTAMLYVQQLEVNAVSKSKKLLLIGCSGSRDNLVTI